MKKNDDSNNSKIINELERDIKRYNKDIKKDEQNDSAYSLKGDALIKLGEAKGGIKTNPEHYEDALKCYNKAIELCPENLMYLSDRSQLYAKMEKPKLAAMDIATIQGLPSTGNGVLDMYGTHTTQDILKLASVQKAVQKLVTEKKLPYEISTAFQNMIKVITGISTRVSGHDRRLDNHEERFKQDEAELAKVKKELEDLKTQFAGIPEFIKELAEVNIKINEIEQQLPKFVVKDVLEAISNKIKQNEQSTQQDKEAMHAKIKSIEERIAGVASQEDVEAIAGELVALKEGDEFTQEMLASIEERIDQLTMSNSSSSGSNSNNNNKTNATTILQFSQLIYDNELLNHSSLLKTALKHYGSNVLELSQNLSAALTEQAANNDDHELLLAGLLSLDN